MLLNHQTQASVPTNKIHKQFNYKDIEIQRESTGKTQHGQHIVFQKQPSASLYTNSLAG